MSFFYKMILPLIIISIVLYSFYQWQLISLNKQLHIENINDKQKKTQNKSHNEVNHNGVTLAFVNLPEPPPTPIKKTVVVQAKKQSPVINKADKEIIKKAMNKEVNSTKATSTYNEVSLPKNADSQKIDKKPTDNKVIVTPVENAQKILQQLTSSNGIKLELAWPTEYNHYQQVLTYFEQCLGIGFGVLEGEQLQVLAGLKNTGAMSSWLREVNGKLTVNEQRLLIKYNALEQQALKQRKASKFKGSRLPYKYVRLFPQVLDQSLARLISQTLVMQTESTGRQFSSLFAHFKVVQEKGGKKLYLNNIKLNQVTINRSWLLHQSQCL